MSQHFIDLIHDSYDNCLAYLDWRLGQLFDELQRRGVLDRTVVIITADHGEELGDHDLFEHGESLYRPEIHVPLLILLPSARPCRSVVRETVSLRDLPATIVDLAGLAAGAPFPGRSLARLWGDSRPEAGAGASLISMERSPSFRNRIRPIPVEVDRRLFEVRSSPWPRRTMFTSATRGTGKRSCFTSATIRSSFSIWPRTRRCSRSSSGSASVSTR